jgi:hypothetical protein
MLILLYLLLSYIIGSIIIIIGTKKQWEIFDASYHDTTEVIFFRGIAFLLSPLWIVAFFFVASILLPISAMGWLLTQGINYFDE